MKGLEGLPTDRFEIAVGDVTVEHTVYRALSSCSQLFHVAGAFEYGPRHGDAMVRNAGIAARAVMGAAKRRGIENIVDGSTVDDLGDYRPGRRAASQHAVRSPLIEAGLTKSEVRELSRRATLPTWDKPASPCLSSRIAYGTTVTIERLSKVDRGEEILREFGFREFRVRHHDQLVRIEIAPAEMDRVLRKELIDDLARRFRELGFKYVTLDLEGFRSGSMNEVIRMETL